MDRKAQSAAAIIIFVVLAIVAVQITAVTVNDRLDLDSAQQDVSYTTGNATENFTLSPVGDELRTSSFVLKDGASTLSSPGDYNVTTSGALTVHYDSAATLNATWSYEPDGYIESGLTRTVVGFAPVFVALFALVGIAAFLRK